MVTPVGVQLLEVLRALPQADLIALGARIDARLDSKKRVDFATQVAWRLVRSGFGRRVVDLGPWAMDVLKRLVEVNGVLNVGPKVPEEAGELTSQGWAFTRRDTEGEFQLLLPIALLLQVPPLDIEEPRAARSLLALCPSDTLGSIAAQYALRRTVPVPSLAIELAWMVLATPERLEAFVGELSLGERRLLETIEQHGGEVETQELLELEREPLRLSSPSGPSLGRRGVASTLERKGLLLPMGPGRYAIPHEVSRVVGKDLREQRARARRAIHNHRANRTEGPLRASFSHEPTSLALALAIEFRTSKQALRSAGALSKTWLGRAAERHGTPLLMTQQIGALARAIGLFGPAALSPKLSPGCLRFAELAAVLADTWRTSSVWDEARDEPEVLRSVGQGKDLSPVRMVREMVLDALRDLGREDWVRFEDFVDYVEHDDRTSGIGHALEKWARRHNVRTPVLRTLTTNILTQSMFALGIIDHGEPKPGPCCPESIRLSASGRSWLLKTPWVHEDSSLGSMVDHRFECGKSTRICDIVGTASCHAEPLLQGRLLTLLFSEQGFIQSLLEGATEQLLRAQLTRLEGSSTVSELIDRACAIEGRASLSEASGFLWMAEALRELLTQHPQTRSMFVSPSPTGGLLVRPEIARTDLVRRCRRAGVHVVGNTALETPIDG